MQTVTVHAIIPSRLAANPISEAGNLFLDRALMSLMWQTRKPDKVIVGLDPGMSAKVPPRMADPWLVFVEATEAGQGHALQAATAASDADVLVYLEDDDQRDKQAIEVALKVMADGADLVTSNQREVDESGGFVRYNDFATPSGWTIKRETLEKAGGWDASYRWHVDNAMLGRLNRANAKRVHLVEDGATRTTEHRRIAWLGNVAAFSAISETTFREPLVTRCIHYGSGMARIQSDVQAGRQSAMERARLVAEFGSVPW